MSAGPKYGFGKSTKIEKADYQPGPGHYEFKSGIKNSEGGCTLGERFKKGNDSYDIGNPGPGSYDLNIERSKSGTRIGKANRGGNLKESFPGPGTYNNP